MDGNDLCFLAALQAWDAGARHIGVIRNDAVFVLFGYGRPACQARRWRPVHVPTLFGRIPLGAERFGFRALGTITNSSSASGAKALTLRALVTDMIKRVRVGYLLQELGSGQLTPAILDMNYGPRYLVCRRGGLSNESRQDEIKKQDPGS